MTMNNLTNDYIVIDTNIFKGLLNPQKNTQCHIEFLLHTLYDDCIYLIIDKGGKIWGEYETSIVNEMTNGHKNSEHNELIRGWLHQDRNLKIVDTPHDVMDAIKNIIGQSKTKDATFVCVAMVSDKTLITNDRADIIDGGNQNGNRRKKAIEISE